MNEHDRYEAWKAELYEALRDNMPEFAGKPTGDTGDFEKVGFALGAAYGEPGKNGGMIVAITITDQNSPRKGKHKQIEANWRNDDPEKVATDAIAAYIKLR
jgi:hypothetical protein